MSQKPQMGRIRKLHLARPVRLTIQLAWHGNRHVIVEIEEPLTAVPNRVGRSILVCTVLAANVLSVSSDRTLQGAGNAVPGDSGVITIIRNRPAGVYCPINRGLV